MSQFNITGRSRRGLIDQIGGEDTKNTISEDIAEGQTARLEENLKRFGANDSKLLLPGNMEEDDEVCITNDTLHRRSKGQKHALADYQMQLMLLEQQNKKRLFVARQARAADDPIGVKDAPESIINLEVPLRTVMPFDFAKLQLQEPESPELSHDERSEEQGSSTPTLIPATQAVSDMERRESNPIVHGTSRTEEGISSVSRDKQAIEQALQAHGHSPHFEVLYRISCQREHRASHSLSTYRDVPFDSGLPELHLTGSSPVLDPRSYIEDEASDIAFVMIKTIECSEAAVLMTRSGEPLHSPGQIYMKSGLAKKAMQEVATCYYQFVPDVGSHYEIRDYPLEQNLIIRPDLFVFHHRHLFSLYTQQRPESKGHVEALQLFAELQFGSAFAEADNLFSQGMVTQTYLTYLFKPNDLIISALHGQPAAFVVQEWPEVGQNGCVTLTCWSLQTDGSSFTRKRSVISIPPLATDSKNIMDLVAYPICYATDELKETLRNRGLKQWELRNATQVAYKGWNVKNDQFFKPDARFMIDHKMYHKMHENAKAFDFERPSRTHLFDRLPASLDQQQEISDELLMLMPPDVYGFYLNEKKWIQLFIDSVHPVTWNKKAYERLVLPSQTKDLVRALVSVRTSQKGVKQGLGVAGKRIDITSGKGNGLIMLLHGGPGTGKTLTAESVAEIAEMALYRVTCGDIGTGADAAERYLNTVLHLGKSWNCVLLLDEADIFLEERSLSDLNRNSLVSVFLRVLEYYDGILILTSNRVGTFDEAFKSRIQVALHYEKLDSSARRKIWENFLEMLEEDEEDVNFDELRLHLDDLADRPLNGRQIRNALTTARQLAMFRAERLDWDHLRQALAVSTDFNEYLKQMQGRTDDQRAA